MTYRSLYHYITIPRRLASRVRLRPVGGDHRMTEQVEAVDAKPSGRRLAFGDGALGMVGIIKLFVQAASLPVMARLLGPAEIGLYALALPVVAFVTMLADGGLGICRWRGSRKPLTSGPRLSGSCCSPA